MRKKISIKDKYNRYEIDKNEELVLRSKIIKKSYNVESEAFQIFEEKLKERVEEDLLKYFNKSDNNEKKMISKKISEEEKQILKRVFLNVVYSEIKKMIKI